MRGAPPPREAAGRSNAAVPWRAYTCLAASMALVGSYVGLSKVLVAALPVFLLAWLRFGIAAIAMLGWVRRADQEPPLTARQRGLVFAESFFGNFLFSICMLGGVARSSALAAGVIMAGLPAAVGLLSWLLLRERIAPRTLAAIACAVGGVAFVSLERGGAGGGPGSSGATTGSALLGNALLVAAVFCEASYVVIGKMLASGIGARRISAWINLWGLVLVTPFGLWQARGFAFAAVPGSIWALLVFYALAASVATVWLWMTGLRDVPASSAGIFTVMLPISAAAIGLVVLGERMSAAQAAAYGLALVGVVLATWPGRGKG